MSYCMYAIRMLRGKSSNTTVRLYNSAEEGHERTRSVTAKYWLTGPKTLRGHHGSALSHIKSGVKILTEVEHNESGEQHHGVLTTTRHPFVEFQNWRYCSIDWITR